MSENPPNRPRHRSPGEGGGSTSLTLRSQPLAIEPSLPARGVRRQRSTPDPGPPPTLSACDWLDTFLDEVLVPGAKTAVAGPPPAVDAAPAPAPAQQNALGRVRLGYSPMIDRNDGVIATRLTIAPIFYDEAIDAAGLLDAVAAVWPADGGAVALNIASEHLLGDVLRVRPTPNVMIEVPAFAAADPRHVGALLELKARGNTLLIKGRPLHELPQAVLDCFRWSIIDLAEERRVAGAPAPAGMKRRIAHVQSGVRSVTQLRESFERGAVAVLGWPLDEPLGAGAGPRPDMQVVIELINRIDRQESPQALEHALTRDPVLAFDLLRHCNSSASGLAVETGSFQHAIMMLGYQRLRRWLALRLAATGDDRILRPANYAALRRGLMMRELAPRLGDAESGGEMFMCGVFSMLDRVFAKPLPELLKTLVVPERVRQALVERRGPFMPALQLVQAAESGLPHEIYEAAERLMIGPVDVNGALLRALAAAAEVE